MKIVYQTDDQGFFTGLVAADPSPLEPGVWLIPGGAVDVEPPVLADGERARWNGAGWTVIAPPPPPEPEPAPTAEELLAALHKKIDHERTRRIEAGAAFPVPGIAAPVPLTGRAKDQSVYLALLIRAQGAKAAGIAAPVLTLRDGADNILTLTPDQMIALIGQAMTWLESVMAVSWAMKDGTGAFADGLPEDWREDQYWP